MKQILLIAALSISFSAVAQRRALNMLHTAPYHPAPISTGGNEFSYIYTQKPLTGTTLMFNQLRPSLNDTPAFLSYTEILESASEQYRSFPKIIAYGCRPCGRPVRRLDPRLNFMQLPGTDVANNRPLPSQTAHAYMPLKPGLNQQIISYIR